MIIFIILAGILALAGIAGIILAIVKKPSDGGFSDRGIFLSVGIACLVIAGVILGFRMIYTQQVGQASVVVSWTGSVVGENAAPGLGTKSPLDRRETFDLFEQQMTFAGSGDSSPSYAGGTVNGQEITGAAKGGASVYLDVQIQYSLGGSNLTDIYTQYKNQESFTQKVIVPKTLSIIRNATTEYTPMELRGEFRHQLQLNIAERLTETLSTYGVESFNIEIQDIRFDEDVETGIRNVEVAQQAEAEARADLRATEVNAQAQVVEAEQEAEANRILTESLTPELLQLRWIEAIRESDGTIVIPDSVAARLSIPPVGGATQ